MEDVNRKVEYGKIMCAVSLEGGSEKLIRHALQLLNFFKSSELYFVHVIENPLDKRYSADGISSVDMVFDNAKEQAEAYIKERIGSFSHSGTIEIIVDYGTAYEKILEIASEKKPDLMVIGIHDKGTISQILLGSVAFKIIKHFNRSVHVVKE
jgi:nucleotide-binding universal stress UspA family protein